MAYYTREQYLLTDCERKFYERFGKGLYPYIADAHTPQDIFEWITEYFTPKERRIGETEKANPVEPLVMPNEVIGGGHLEIILENITNQIDKETRIEIVIEEKINCIKLYHGAEYIGAYECSETLKTIDDLLEYVIGRAKHLQNSRREA